jgi:D-glycero-beta-D-manno-heptose-7-phosphate kinase
MPPTIIQQMMLSPRRVRGLLQSARQNQILVLGDVMLDQFVWGTVGRISPEAPVPVVELQRESFMPGGAGNVARNLRALDVPVVLFGVVGQDAPGAQLKELLRAQQVGCTGIVAVRNRPTSVKTRVVAHTQQVVRIDREAKDALGSAPTAKLIEAVERLIPQSPAMIIGDYGKGVVSEELLQHVKVLCREHGVWLSMDPKPVHRLDLSGLSLITPNRKETFELAGLPDETRKPDPKTDENLMKAAEILLQKLNPALLLITLGELGMLLCQRGQKPFHIPTIAREVFDVSGAGDTVIASFTLAIAAGASPIEAAAFSNHAAGIVVGKVGTATVTAEELLASFK